MDLLLDLGNTRLKWGWATDGHIAQTGAVAWTDASATDLLADAAGDRVPQRVALASVVAGEMAGALAGAAERRWGTRVAMLRSTAYCAGVRNGYAQADQLGVDRLAALVGAWQRQPGRAAVVADAGSALTVDVLDVHGHHLGGSIGPGLALARESFYTRTQRRIVTGEARPDGLARNTADAVASGALVAALGAITRAWHLHHVRSGLIPMLWLTGGDAPALAAALEIPHLMAPHLVLEGMASMLGECA